MDKIGSFVNVKKHNLFFNGCQTCQGDCCNGAKGFAVSPLILEDFEKVYKNFAIAFAVKEKKLVAYVILNNGKGHCKYYIDDKCSIYDQRTPACKLYPISPYFENILVDTECPSVNSEFGTAICSNGMLSNDFYTSRLENFKEKLEETTEFYKSIYNINNYKFIGDILGTQLLRYAKPSDNKYIKMHQESLQHFSRN